MLVLSGQHSGLSSRTVKPKPGDTWEQFEDRTLRIFNGRFVEYVRLMPTFDVSVLPKEGEQVSVEVSTAPYRKRDGSPGVELKGWRVAGTNSGTGQRPLAAVSGD